MPTNYGVAQDYEYSETHKRERIQVWSGPFMSVWEAEGYSLPKGDGYMLTTYNDDKVRVVTPLRTADNYQEVDSRISDALNLHHDKRGDFQVTV